MRKLDRLRGLPKSRLKRLLWRLRPKRLADYWFSRDGAIMGLKVTGLTILVLFVLTLGVFAYFRKFLPDLRDISGSSLGGSISYYDRSGKNLLWQDYDAVKRVPVQDDQISQFMKDATIAVEDRDFFKHRGFDIRGITRALIHDIYYREGRQGGSTITQQLVKLNLDWQEERTLARKVKELILAVELERTYSKEDILTGYLNTAPYGGISYGVQVAASDYFRKSAKDLTLPEAAMLAAIPRSPTLYSPYSGEYFDREAFMGRYHHVLNSMVSTGAITKQQAEEAKKFDVLATVQKQQPKYAGIKAPYFLLAAKNEIINKWAPKGPGSAKIGGWKVITTMDLELQELAEKTVQNNRRNAASRGADAQALVVEDVQTGQMMALVGGNDFDNEEYGKINYAQWNISPGSSFKPYDYSAFIENSNAGAGSVLYDVQQPLPGYPCTNKARPSFSASRDSGGNCLYNYDLKYPGPETVRYALGGSRNVPAVKAMLSVVPGNTTASVNKTISTANAMMAAPSAYRCFKPGTDVSAATKDDEAQCFGASAIGDGAYLHLDQHVNGVATLARLGQALPSTYILKIFDSSSDTKPFHEWKQPKKGDADVKQAIKEETAYLVNDILSDSRASYMSSKWHGYKGWKTAIKTGTTNNSFDGLMMAWNTKYAVGSWVGHHTRNRTFSGFAEALSGPLTRTFMQSALDKLDEKPVSWKQPNGIKTMPAFVVRAHVGTSSVEPSPSTDIFPSWYKPKSGGGQSVTIDKVSGKIASDCTPSLARQTLGGNDAPTTFSVDVFYPPGGSATAATNTPEARDDVHSCSDARPIINLTVSEQGDGKYTFTAFVQQGTHPFSSSQYPQYPGTVNFFVNGQNVGSRGVSAAQDTVSMDYTATSSGNATVTAQVIDSVLYDTTSNAVTVNFQPGGTGPPTITSANASGGTTTINWSGGSPNFTAYNANTNTPLVGGNCSGNSGSSCSVPTSSAPPGTPVYVRDGGNKQSSTVTVGG